MRNFHSSIDQPHLINGFDFWGQSSVNAEDFSFNYGTDTEVIEYFCAVLPRIGISVFSNGFIVKSVDGGDLPGLVVASQEGDVSWVLQFEAQ